MDSTTSQKPAAIIGFYAQPDLTSRGRFSKSHLYNLMARGHFPHPVLRMGPRFTRWSAVQCDQWFADPAAWIAANSGEKGGGI